MRKLPLTLIVAVIIPSSSLYADIQNCSGVWTNSDCASVAKERIEEKAYQPQSEEERVAGRKRFLFNDLDLRRLAANREHNLSFDVSVARDVCLAADSSLEDCQRVVAEAHTQLGQQIAAARVGSTVERKQDEPAPGKNVVVVQNTQQDIYVVKPRRHGYRDGDHPNEPDRPLGPPKPRSELGSIWEPPGSSIPETVPMKREPRRDRGGYGQRE